MIVRPAQLAERFSRNVRSDELRSDGGDKEEQGKQARQGPSHGIPCLLGHFPFPVFFFPASTCATSAFA